MGGIYVHDVLDEIVKLLNLPENIVEMSGVITIQLAVGDCVRVTYEARAESQKVACND